jgi:spore coat protein CotH
MKIPKLPVAVVVSIASLLALPSGLKAQASSALFNPFTVIPLNLDLDPVDWEEIRADETFKIKKPAMLYADGETPLLVTVRRKSATPVGAKVSLKIDINDLVKGQLWRGVNKLSLENGDDADVLAEGIAWMMHRFAAENQPAGGRYQPGLAAWLNLRVNGDNIGVLLNVEEVDKQFLRNRNLWKGSQTWLYKQDDIGPAELKEGDPDSPTVVTLNYSPFVASSGKGKNSTTVTAASDATAAQLVDLIDMEGMLTLGAVNAFSSNPDELFNKGKNFFWADSLTWKRLYFPWDLDAVIRAVDSSIYGTGKGKNFNQADYQKFILNNSTFRLQYNTIMLRLLDDGSLGSLLTAFLDDLEPVLTPYLDADPDSKMAGRAAERFDEIRSWIVVRNANVRLQVMADMAVE